MSNPFSPDYKPVAAQPKPSKGVKKPRIGPMDSPDHKVRQAVSCVITHPINTVPRTCQRNSKM